MEDTDRNHKYQKWVFTLNASDDNKLPTDSQLESILISVQAEDYVFQKECVTREHFQGYFKVAARIRKLTLLNKFKTPFDEKGFDLRFLTVDRMQGTQEQTLAYCTKLDSRVGLPVYSKTLQPYVAKDLSMFEDPKSFHPWQNKVMNLVLQDSVIRTPHDREIHWIYDEQGGTGKSKFVKYLCYNYKQEITKLSFGSGTQLRTAAISAGPKKVYFIDIPRTLGRDDDLHALISVIEDIKNGFIVSSMYGKHQTLMFEPPHIFILANIKCPTSLMSKDRWVSLEIHPYNKDFKNV